jgi:hypothetical protein
MAVHGQYPPSSACFVRSLGSAPFFLLSSPPRPFGQAVARASNFAAVREPDAIARWRWRCGEQKQKGLRALTLTSACGRVVEGRCCRLGRAAACDWPGGQSTQPETMCSEAAGRDAWTCSGRAGRRAGRFSAGLGISPARLGGCVHPLACS